MMLGVCAHSPCPVSKWELSESGRLSPAQLRTSHAGVPETDVRERYAVNLISFSLGGVLMRTWLTHAWALACRFSKFAAAAAALSLLTATAASAQSTDEAGGEAALKLPDLTQVQFLGVDGHKL